MPKTVEIIGTGGPWLTGPKPPPFESLEERMQRKIRERAHQIWESNGRPEGKEALYWEIAEEEVRGL